MGCGCNKGSNLVTRYRVMHGTLTKDFVTKVDADKYRSDNKLTVPVQVVKVPKT